MGRRAAIVIPLMKHDPVGRREQSITAGIERKLLRARTILAVS